jgi:hypothetical protein
MHQMRISTICVSSDAQVERFGIVMTVKNPKNKTKSYTEIELNPSKDRAMREGDNPSFEMNL